MSEPTTDGAGAPGQPAGASRGGLSVLDALILQRLADHVRDQGIELSAAGGMLQQFTMVLLKPFTGCQPPPPAPD
jgi:hypothetical protein